MKQFENGIGYYTKMHADIMVAFPEDCVCCRYCPFCRAEKELGRFWCRLTNDMLYCPEMKGLPEGCPLREEKE